MYLASIVLILPQSVHDTLRCASGTKLSMER